MCFEENVTRHGQHYILSCICVLNILKLDESMYNKKHMYSPNSNKAKYMHICFILLLFHVIFPEMVMSILYVAKINNEE